MSEEAPAELRDDEVERSKVFSEHLALLASSGGSVVRTEEGDVVRTEDGRPLWFYPEVKDFRVRYLDDQLLSPSQAWALLISPVAAHWPYFWFEKFGIPLVGHNYQVGNSTSDERGPYSLVEVFASNAEGGCPIQTFKDRRKPGAGSWALPETPVDARSNARLRREFKRWRVVPFPGEDGRPYRTLAKPGSVLGDLHDKVTQLIRRYPWDESDATWFVLTGETPLVAPLTWQARWFGDHETEDTFSYGFVTLKIEPWVPAETVEQVYRDIQRKLRGGHHARRLKKKNLELLRFVNERVNKATLSLKERRRLAPDLVAAWDKANPEDTYNGDTWKFWRDYHRARRAVLFPTYEWPGDND